VERAFVQRADDRGSNSGWVKTKTDEFAPVASLVGVYNLSPRAGLVGPVSV